MPQNPRASQEVRCAAVPPDAVLQSRDAVLQSQPSVPVSARSGQSPLVIILVLGLVVALGAGAAVLLLGGPNPDSGHGLDQPEQQPGPAPAAAQALGGVVAGALPVRGELTGTVTLSDPEISTVKAPVDTPGRWCELLTAADILAVTGVNQAGAPDAAMMCTHYLAGGAGYLLVSDIPAVEGAPYLVRGNSAIVFQRDPKGCEVSVALNHGGGVLDIDIRGGGSPRVAPCDVAVLLAARAFDRLPEA